MVYIGVGNCLAPAKDASGPRPLWQKMIGLGTMMSWAVKWLQVAGDLRVLVNVLKGKGRVVFAAPGEELLAKKPLHLYGTTMMSTP